MKLEDFRVEKDLSYAGLAAHIGRGVTAKMAERYCKGTRPRDKKIMLRIVKISDGLVTPNDWYDLDVAEPAKPDGKRPGVGKFSLRRRKISDKVVDNRP